MTAGTPGATRRPLARVVLVAPLLVVAGCASTPPTSPPTGIDEMTVPTPSPDPGDFTDVVDNPYFPLAEEPRWTYEAADGSTVRLEVLGPASIAGVPVTTLRRTTTDGEGGVVGERRSSYAQDRDGNVWSFGRQVLSGPGESWLAGEDGAEAGLLVPDEPRVGDGWLQQDSPTLRTRVEVVSTETAAEVLGGQADVLETEDVASTPDGEERVVRYYAPGVGVVRVTDARTGETLLELVELSD